MIFNDFTFLDDFSLLLLRITVALVFLSSGRSHMLHPVKRSGSIGMNKSFTFLLGLGELAGGILVLLGLWIQPGALLLILVMLGAINFKIFRWKTGFFSKESTGWHYDLLILSSCLIFITQGPGMFSLMHIF